MTVTSTASAALRALWVVRMTRATASKSRTMMRMEMTVQKRLIWSRNQCIAAPSAAECMAGEDAGIACDLRAASACEDLGYGVGGEAR